MRELPILFKGEMVRAVLEDRKTQTRRVIKPQPARWYGTPHVNGVGNVWLRETDQATYLDTSSGKAVVKAWPCPYGVPGDKLWVRETWRPVNDPDYWDCVEYRADGKRMKPMGLDEDDGFRFNAQCEAADDAHPIWKPSIFMPRWASRIQLEVTGVRVERIRDITPEDCLAEGIEMRGSSSAAPFNAVNDFHRLWDSINDNPPKRPYGWKENPWVWAVTFKRLP